VLLPTLSLELQTAVRIAYGILMLLTLAAAAPHAKRYFRSERWGGYAESSAWTDAIQNPFMGPVVLVTWGAAAIGLVAGRRVLAASVVNLACCYYFFIRMRWRSVTRGMGAPGFIAFWLGAAVCLLELTTRHAIAVRGLVLLTLQIDFALIMVSAGLYKLVAGYRHSSGMELGMVNPEWGYWPSFWRTWRPSHPLFRFLDEMAWATEVAGGVLMLVPATRLVGSLAILLSFVFIATQIRLGFLCEMVIVCCLLFFGGTAGERALLTWLPSIHGAAADPGAQWPGLAAAVTVFCWMYIVALPIVRTGMFYNQLRHRSLPRLLQQALDAYANTFGLILWRVFTADVVNFFIRVWQPSGAGAPRRLISEYPRTGPSRFSQVAECIAITSVFTTLKYYPSNRPLFVERLLRYARTIPREPSQPLIFEWVDITTENDRFAFVPITEFTVDLDARAATETARTTVSSRDRQPAFSPVHEAVRPGSYAPLNPDPSTKRRAPTT
jgi:hypothetical protein